MDIQNKINDNFLVQNDINRYSHHAMNTIFEIFIKDEDAKYSGEAAHEAFKEIDLMENELSKFIPNSDISRINNLAVNENTIVSENTFACLKDCEKIFEITNGMFNVNFGDLIVRRENISVTNNLPEGNLRKTNQFPLKFDETNFIVEVKSNVIIDLGGYGKGYAVDKAAELLIEWGIDNFMISGGKSTIFAANSGKHSKGWPLTISMPRYPYYTIENIFLQNFSLSGSGLQKGNHILNPSTSKPSERIAAWSLCKNAAWSDAFSTAFMILPEDGIEKICSDHSLSAVIIGDKKNTESVKYFGDFFPGTSQKNS